MTFYGYEIDSPVSNLCISQDDADNLANCITYGDGIIFCSYMKSVSGKQQIFIGYSTDDGETWTSEQVTASAYDHYASSCAVNAAGTGLHLVYSAKGFGATATQKSHESIIYQFRDADGVWSGETVVCQCQNYTSYWYYNQPSIAVDFDDNVHMVCRVAYNYNPYFSRRFWNLVYMKRTATTSTWGNLAWLRYGYGNNRNCIRPNIQIDSYCNPHIVFVCKAPTSAYNLECYTTVWVANFQEGLFAGWPGAIYAGYVRRDVVTELENFHVLCDKYKLASGGPGTSVAPSFHSRISLSHTYDADTHDYPHCIYNYQISGTAYSTGYYYTWRDADGWHDEIIAAGAGDMNSPSIALNPNGKIHAIHKSVASGSTTFDYRYRDNPVLAWSTKISVTSLYYARQMVQMYPTQSPLDSMPCSPFIAVELEGGVNKLKYYKCADVSTITGYGYFM